jgi:PAS domain S-box-containing protein
MGTSSDKAGGASREEERRSRRMERLLAHAEERTGIGTWMVELRTMKVTWSDQLFRLHGFRPGEVEPTMELGLSHIHPDDREEIEARAATMLEAPATGRSEYRLKLDDGTVRHVIGESIVERDENGKPVRLFGTVRDVTDSVSIERELDSHHELSRALAEWDDLDEGMVDLLRRLGTAMDWDAANFWARADRGDSLVCRDHWSARPDELSEFEQAMRELRIPPTQGVVRRAWDLMEPVSIEDASTDPRLFAKTPNVEAGLGSALLFPAVHKGETLAVLAFHGKEPRYLTDRLTRTLRTLGQDLGRFLAARRGELGFGELSDRELEVLQLAAEGLTTPQIAARLTIGPTTVKTHLSHAYRKLDVPDRASAVAKGLRQGLIS